jgi:sn-glycerol 3-phosphate transport system substrate-binding protein
MPDNAALMGGHRRVSREMTKWVAAALAICAGGCSGTDPVDTSSAPTTTAAPRRIDSTTTSPVEPKELPGAPATTVPASFESPAARCTPEPTEYAAGTVTLWYTFAGSIAEEILSSQIEAFEAGHSGIDVVAERHEGPHADVLADFARLPTEQRPDLLLGSNMTVRNQFDLGTFIPPSECNGGTDPAVLADLLPVIRRQYTVEGVLQAAPYNISTPVMMYDRARWKRAGLDPDDPPSAWDDLFAVIDILRESGETEHGLVLYDQAGAWLVERAAAEAGRFVVEPRNGRDGSEVDAVEFEHPGLEDLLIRLGQMELDGRVRWVGTNAGGQDDLLSLVYEPLAGMTFHTSASLGDIRSVVAQVPELAGAEIGVAPLPGAPMGTPGGGAWWLADRGDPAQASAAWRLAEWLASPAQVAALAAATGYVPTSPAAAAEPVIVTAWEARPGLRVAYDVLQATPGDDSWAGPQVGPMLEFGREMELAAAFPIDAQTDPLASIDQYERLAEEDLAAYAALMAG